MHLWSLTAVSPLIWTMDSLVEIPPLPFFKFSCFFETSSKPFQGNLEALEKHEWNKIVAPYQR
ncbi:hypothetical protein CY35_18G021200 [Sphagnum magellanicum]|nr:hypothetical protein CY35_18G021200 [Sphagnum magellanicum]